MSFDQPQIGAQLIYNEDEQAWQLVSTGETLAQTAIHAEIRTHATLSATMFGTLTDDLYNGGITVGEWQNAVFSELKEGHTANAMFAAGTSDLSPEAIRRLETTIAKEADFLAGFADDIADGKLSFNQARARAAQYAKAMEQSYWNEWQSDIADAPQFEHLDELPTVPGAGDTRCRGNCQCILEFTDTGIWWRLFPAEHCPDCIDLADGSPYKAR
jgi:hypothetical protein